MTNGTSTVLRRGRKRRVYPGENQSYLLIRWLNHPHNDKEKGRVASLIEICKRLSDETLSRDFPAASVDPRRPGLIGTRAQFANLRRASEWVKRLNRALATLRLRPRYVPSAKSGGRVSWVHATNKNRLNISIFAGGAWDEIAPSEADAIASVLRLLEEGHVHRMRKCACGKWFYRRFTHQTFCGNPCQQRDFRRTDEYRKKRRKYMREHRMTLAKMAGRKFKARLARRTGEP